MYVRLVFINWWQRSGEVNKKVLTYRVMCDRIGVDKLNMKGVYETRQ